MNKLIVSKSSSMCSEFSDDDSADMPAIANYGTMGADNVALFRGVRPPVHSPSQVLISPPGRESEISIEPKISSARRSIDENEKLSSINLFVEPPS